MYVYVLCQNYKKAKTSAKSENSKNTNKVTLVNKQLSKLCNASRVKCNM